MTNPIQFSADHEVEAGYLRYRFLGPGENVARTDRVSEDVAVDYDAAGQVLGIELLSFSDEALAVARTFAAECGLSFPQSLEGVPASPIELR